MNDYDMRGVNDYNEFIINYTNDLKRFLIDITISYVMILFLTFILIMKKINILNTYLFLPLFCFYMEVLN